ncbi:hypothetical protein AYO45_00350 [Gammaproteobacteria bacterium SCGC AG-212-F23]|nr:hypothetical protein AYO45_00350 [Gammaproteobacteria bacterium SCGC AG-212-F23]
MKKRLIKPIKQDKAIIIIYHKGTTYHFPKAVADKYIVDDDEGTVDAEDVFREINEKYTKAGALLRGVRVSEGLTQIEMADLMKVTQSDISQMENGTRKIGRKIAKRIEKLFDTPYRLFLE